MGNEQSGLDRKAEQRLNHPKMKHVQFLKNNEIMQAVFNIESEDQFHAWENSLSRLKKFDEYFLLLPKAYEFAKKGVCGSSGVLHVDYDNYPYLLHDEIETRNETKKYFNEAELWYLFYGLASAASVFKKIGSKVGDIQSRNIFLNEEGQIKISNVCSWPSEHQNYAKLIFEHMNTYVSPEQLSLAREGRVDIYSSDNKSRKGFDKYLCQSFSIGLTMLESALLISSASLYDNKEPKFNQQELTRRVQLLLQNKNAVKYSKALRIAIAEVCELNPSDRMQAVDLYELLKPHDSELVNLKQINVDPNFRNRAKYQQIILGGQDRQKSVDSPPSYLPSLPNNYAVKPNQTTTSYGLTNYGISPYLQNNSANNSYSNNTNTMPYSSPYFNTNNYTFPKKNFDPSPSPTSYGHSYSGTYTSLDSAKIYQPKLQNQYTSPLSSVPVTSSGYYLASANYTNEINNTKGQSSLADPFRVSPYSSIPNPSIRKADESTGLRFGEPKSKPSFLLDNPQYKTEQKNIKSLELSSGNAYLQNIYSRPESIQTPTFPTSINSISSNKNAYDTMFKMKPEQSGVPAYNFSNISSISRDQYDSRYLMGDKLEAFTPTKAKASGSKSEDSSADFLKKINDDILKSQQKFVPAQGH